MIPLNLTSIDVGNPAIPGSTLTTPQGYLLRAGGADIWGQRDEFHFTGQQHTGDFDATVRVASHTLSHPYAKAGLMIRATLDDNAAMFYHFVFPDNRLRNNNNGGHESHVRSQAGEKCRAIYPADSTSTPPPFPVTWPNTWLRVTRRGQRYESWASTDGSNWAMFCSVDTPLPETVWLGLAVCSHDAAKECAGEFCDLRIEAAR